MVISETNYLMRLEKYKALLFYAKMALPVNLDHKFGLRHGP